MATCPPDCGMCCEKIYLSEAAIGRLLVDPIKPLPLVHSVATDKAAAEDQLFTREHWTVTGEPPKRLRDVFPVAPVDDDTKAWHVVCDMYKNGRCTAYETRPPICSEYPFYGREGADRLGSVDHTFCAYHEDVPGRRVLPLIVLRSN